MTAGRLALVVAATLALGACARNTMPVASPADSERAATRWPGTTSADLAEGRRLYISRCSSCHLPIEPRSIEAAAWPGHVAEMSERANLSPTEVQAIERYLVIMATPPEATAPASPAAAAAPATSAR